MSTPQRRVNQENQMEVNLVDPIEHEETPTLRKWWVWLLIVLAIIVAVGIFTSQNEEEPVVTTTTSTTTSTTTTTEPELTPEDAALIAVVDAWNALTEDEQITTCDEVVLWGAEAVVDAKPDAYAALDYGTVVRFLEDQCLP